MKTPEQIADEVSAGHFETYQDSAEEVGHPEGQPIVETWPALRECIAAAIEADRAQRRYDVGKITLHWTCNEFHDETEHVEQSLASIEEVGTAICPECGADMELDSTVTVR